MAARKNGTPLSWFHFRRNKRGTSARGTLPSSQYDWLYGRRRLAEVPYLLPNDQSEVNRLDLQHFMLKMALGGNITAPVKRPLSILDVGCGTGRWACELAEEYPQTNVVGVDITNSVQNMPDNFTFVSGNILDRLPFADATFDYVHMRFLALAIPITKWPTAIQEMLRVTQIGGWIELVEFNTPAGGGPAFERIQSYWHQLADKFGMSNTAGTQIAPLLRDAGLSNVRDRAVVINTLDQRNRAGRLAIADLYSGLSSSRPALIATGLTTAPEFDTLTTAVRDEITQHNTAWEIHAAHGQRMR